jgi:hypothetical protein
MSSETVTVRVATPDEPLPHTALLEQALSAMADVQERAEPGFSPDVAVIPAEDWRAFIDAHAEILLLWTAWRDSPYRERADGVKEAPASAAFFDPALIAKAVMTPEEEDTVRRGCCPKCMERSLGEPTEGGGVQFRQCRRCTSIYAIGVAPCDKPQGEQR